MVATSTSQHSGQVSQAQEFVIGHHDAPNRILIDSIILLGPINAGKGEASKILRTMNWNIMSMSSCLKHNKTAQESIKNGRLVEDELVLDIFAMQLINHFKGRRAIDGFPRTVNQAVKALPFLGSFIVFHFDVTDELCIQRASDRRICPECCDPYTVAQAACLECDIPLISRDDDHPETVKKRLVDYHEQTEPICFLDEYQERMFSIKSDTTPDAMEFQIKSIFNRENIFY